MVKQLYLRKVQRHGSQTCPIHRVHLVLALPQSLPMGHQWPPTDTELAALHHPCPLTYPTRRNRKNVFWRDKDTIQVPWTYYNLCEDPGQYLKFHGAFGQIQVSKFQSFMRYGTSFKDWELIFMSI